MLVAYATCTMHMTMLEFTEFGAPHGLHMDHVFENLARKFVVEIHGHILARRFNHPSRERIPGSKIGRASCRERVCLAV